MKDLMNKYVEEKCKSIDNKEVINSYIEDKNKLFEDEKEVDIEDSIDIDY